jgi:hypothetical protein
VGGRGCWCEVTDIKQIEDSRKDAQVCADTEVASRTRCTSRDGREAGQASKRSHAGEGGGVRTRSRGRSATC